MSVAYQTDIEMLDALASYGPPPYFQWNARRIRTCLAHLADTIPVADMRTLDIGHDVFVGLVMRRMKMQLVGNIGPEISTATPDFVEWPLVSFDMEQPLPFATASFQLVTMMEVIEHVRDNPRRLLRELARILVPGGYLYLGTPNATSWDKIIRNLRRHAINDALPYSQDYGPRHGMCHTYEYGSSELRDFVASESFEIISLKTWDPYSMDPVGFRHTVLKAAFTASLLGTFFFREAASLWYNRGHQISLVARRL